MLFSLLEHKDLLLFYNSKGFLKGVSHYLIECKDDHESIFKDAHDTVI